MRLYRTPYPLQEERTGRYQESVLHMPQWICLILALVFAVLGAAALLTAPAETGTADSRQLQAELAANAASLASMQSAQSRSTVQAESDSDAAVFETAASDETENTAQSGAVPVITAVGDSVMLGAAPAILEAFPGSTVDAKESRQVWDAPDVFAALREAGEINDTVVIALGLNCYFTEETGQDAIDAAGDGNI